MKKSKINSLKVISNHNKFINRFDAFNFEEYIYDLELQYIKYTSYKICQQETGLDCSWLIKKKTLYPFNISQQNRSSIKTSNVKNIRETKENININVIQKIKNINKRSKLN